MPKLTAIQLKAIKATDIGTIIRDDGGLWGKVKKSGDGVSVSFYYRYRWQSKTRDTACGTWPNVGLAEIRKARDVARELVSNGIDPNTRKADEKRERQIREEQLRAEQAERSRRLTIRDLFDKWEAAELSSRKDGGAETRRGFLKDVLPLIGDRYAEEIKRGDVMKIIDTIKARGAFRLANRVLAEMRQMFGYATVRELVPADPTSGIEKRHAGGQDGERDRTLSDKELRALPAALESASVLSSTKHVIWLILATSVRIGELVKAQRRDIDLNAGTWRIPAPNSKNSDAHLVSLSPFALEHMRALMSASTSETWLMPISRGKEDLHVDPKSITKQISDRQLKFYDRKAHGKRTKHENALVLGNEKWTPHDLRRTSATLMQELGVLPVVVEKCLNHRDENRIRRTYQRYDYAKEKQEAWRLVGERLRSLIASMGADPS
ncbi:tyrosine-type recombinase/integrase [Burkholderia vietnamiensis]|uniref:tyrosine-type recombinase/integrase n=1 Tax=Burkholderia vietnamiensis TaxID=60552 RepID=UPI001592FF5C|nr:site-specific integrase [Burkholderia vietnamiensis]